jgi:hypothetical protein
MSIRRQIGDILKKKANAGFISEEVNIQIPDVSENHHYDYCMYHCGDDSCREWATVWILDKDGKVVGATYHVSECQMEGVE